MKFPNFFIIGAPKCGTTSLYNWLKQNRRVFLSQPKEPGFFSTDIAPSHFSSLNEYRQLFAGAEKRHRAIGEASTLYLRSNEAVRRILEHQSDARFIVLLRSPLEIAPSLHAQEIYNLNEDILSFEIAWRAQAARRVGRRIPQYCTSPALLQYGDACRLGSQLERVFDLVQRQRVLTIFLEDMKLSPKVIYERTTRFLRVPEDSKPCFDAANQRKTYRSKAVARALKNAAALKRAIGLSKFSTGMLTPIHRINSRAVEASPLTGRIREELAEYFRDEIAKLGRLTGRDLSHWLG